MRYDLGDHAGGSAPQTDEVSRLPHKCGNPVNARLPHRCSHFVSLGIAECYTKYQVSGMLPLTSDA
jgi:hypothetical protein